MSDEERVSVDDAIGQLSDDALGCRDVGHRWGGFIVKRIEGGFERTFECDNCTTERKEELSSHGRKIKAKYDYPENYLVKGVGRFTGEYKERARLENILMHMKTQKKSKGKKSA